MNIDLNAAADAVTRFCAESAAKNPTTMVGLAVVGAGAVGYAATQAVIAAVPSVKAGIGVAAFSVQVAAEGAYTTVSGWFSSAKAA